MGRISAVTSGDARKDQRQDQQVQKLRDAAQSRFDSILASIESGTSQSESPSDQDGSNTALAKHLENAINALQEGLVERDTEVISPPSRCKIVSCSGVAAICYALCTNLQVRLLLLAALAGEHILFIGPPGTAKSELGRRLARLYDGQFFERLLTRFSVPEVRQVLLEEEQCQFVSMIAARTAISWSTQELFGPLSMRALEEDKYIRQIDGYLPSAKVAFIDEVFKANSAILNTLLTILNERLFDNGSKRIEVPLICLVNSQTNLCNHCEASMSSPNFISSGYCSAQKTYWGLKLAAQCTVHQQGRSQWHQLLHDEPVLRQLRGDEELTGQHAAGGRLQ